jgi:hypothetical protein
MRSISQPYRANSSTANTNANTANGTASFEFQARRRMRPETLDVLGLREDETLHQLQGQTIDRHAGLLQLYDDA